MYGRGEHPPSIKPRAARRGYSVGSRRCSFVSSRRRHTRFKCDWSSDVCFSYQAEDGIRDSSVTGVQTCALPILGFDLQRIQFNQNTSSQVGGILTFTNVSNFLQGIPSQLDFAIPGGIDPVRGYRQTLLAFFVQDDLKLRRNLAVNLGLRYETLSVPTEVNGKIANLRTPTDPKITVGGDWYKNPSLRNFAPRIGLGGDPFSDRKTLGRAGFR